MVRKWGKRRESGGWQKISKKTLEGKRGWGHKERVVCNGARKRAGCG